MYIFYCGTKGQTDVKQNYSFDVRDDAQYKTNIYFVHFVPQNYLANMRVTHGTCPFFKIVLQLHTITNSF